MRRACPCAWRTRARVRHLVVLAGTIWLCAAHPAVAQDLTPRAYLITPVGSNAVVLGYSHLEGGLQFDGAVPITGAQADINLPSASYYHGFGLFGRSANITLTVPYGVGSFQGTVADVPRRSDLSGFLDAVARLSVNLIGGPALEPQEFARWQQNVLLGASLKIVAPTGQYDPMKLINWGTNRWAFKPEIGYSQRFGHWVLDSYAGVWFFTENPEYFSYNMYYPGVRSQTEAPVGAFEAHLSYDFARRLWVSLDGNYWWGGATSINGIQNGATNQKSSRVGITASVPLTVHQSIKLSYSDGAYIRYGGNYRSISLGWQYSWIGWKLR